jgi:hypothetical protein
MRSLVSPVVLLAFGAAGTLPAQTVGTGWSLRVGVAREAFTGASTDTTTIPRKEVEVAPAPRVAFEAGASRRIGAWEIRMSGGYAPGGLRAKTDVLLFDDRTSDVKRFRAALLVGRRIASLGPSELLLMAGPSVDHWKVPGIGDRTTLAGRAGLTLSIPLGGLRFTNNLLFGLGGSPFQRHALPPEARVRPLRTWSVGAELVFPLSSRSPKK